MTVENKSTWVGLGAVVAITVIGITAGVILKSALAFSFDNDEMSGDLSDMWFGESAAGNLGVTPPQVVEAS